MSPFIFAFIAALLCGPLTDYVAKRFSEANNGPYEFYLLISANLIFLQGVFELRLNEFGYSESRGDASGNNEHNSSQF